MEKSSFFNSVSGDRKYKAEDWASYFSSFIGNGVFPVPSTGLQVVAGSGMQVTVKAGKAWINGYFYNNTSDLSFTLGTADGVLNRIDRLVIRWDLTNRTMSAKLKSSTYASSPTAPMLERTSDIYELALADIAVGAGVTEITGSVITDKRLDSTLCGVVAAVVNQIDTTAFNNQLEAWMNEFETESSAEFENWFNSVKDTLSEDAAGNLLNLINGLDESKANISDIPTSLPANGGNADTVDNKHASDFLAVTGGTATGNLAIEMGGFPQFKLANTANNTKAIVVLGTHNIQLCQYNASDGTTYRRLTLFDSAGTSNIANALTLNDYISGTGTAYMVYGSHNVTVSTAAPTAALATNAMHMVY